MKVLRMARIMGMALLLPFFGCSAEQGSIAGLVGGQWTNAEGRSVTLGSAMGTKATVLVTLDPTCPYCQLYAPDLEGMAKRFAPDGVRFIGVYAGPFMGAKETARFAQQAGLSFPQLMDAGCSLTTGLKARVTPEAFITDTQGTVVYRGAIDDRAVREGRQKYQASKHYLEDALTAFLRDGSGSPEVKAVGCIVECGK